MKSLPDLLDMEMQLEAALIEVRAAIREQVNRTDANKVTLTVNIHNMTSEKLDLNDLTGKRECGGVIKNHNYPYIN